MSVLLFILRVEEPLARELYEKPCQRERWSTRELERPINSRLFERLALSRDTTGVLALARESQQVQSAIQAAFLARRACAKPMNTSAGGSAGTCSCDP